MHLDYTPEQESLRKELREYFADLLSDVVRAELGHPGEGSPKFRELVRQMGTDGWLGIGWPKEYGGQGRSAVEQFIFFDEVQRAGAPFPFVTLNTVGPTIMRFGSEEQKKFFLPGILAGAINFAIGYTEPEAGTDLASLRTRAVRDGDEFVVNGNKVFTSGANQADYIWLAARTDADAPKHKGISIFAVPTSSPGFSWSPIVTVAGNVTTATYYGDVHVPTSALIGQENEGWRMITTQLNHERVGLAAMGGGLAQRLAADVAEWARREPACPEGDRLIDVPWVQLGLARVHARLEAMKLLNWRMTSALDRGELGPADSSAVKVYGTECLVDVYRTLLEVLGPVGYVREGSPGAVLHGRVEQAARAAQINTFGGGVNEVQREIVAAAGLGMARQAR
ncbi:MAG TPA: acyl-CoA dehydrogenase family protein [Acidimicrobiales bacterium]|nr:acyl-CoA dehydrogenase family protein [Acidimicrobiales bacterium]